MSAKEIRVLLVDDSSVILNILKRTLESANIRVVGTAQNGEEALELIPRLQPSVICTDLDMPKMDGLQFIKVVMDRFPTPILVISSTLEGASNEVFPLLEAGALDVLPKPRGDMSGGLGHYTDEIIQKVKVLSGVVVFSKRTKNDGESVKRPEKSRKEGVCMVAIGASTGGPPAFARILSQLPADFSAPIVCVQHISVGFTAGLTSWLSGRCALKVQIAQAGEIPQKGCIYFAPEVVHLVLNNNGEFQYTNDPPVEGHRPSVTKTFDSVAGIFGRRSVGVLLSGMGADGAQGLLSIQRAGGRTIVQDEQSCSIFGMPRAAIGLQAAQHVLPLDDISSKIKSLVF